MVAPAFLSGRTRGCCIGASPRVRPPVTTPELFWNRPSAFRILGKTREVRCEWAPDVSVTLHLWLIEVGHKEVALQIAVEIAPRHEFRASTFCYRHRE